MATITNKGLERLSKVEQEGIENISVFQVPADTPVWTHTWAFPPDSPIINELGLSHLFKK